MSGNASYQSPLNSPVQLAVPSSAVDVPRDMQNYVQPIYTSLYTLLDALTRYCGISAMSQTEAMIATPDQMLRPQNNFRFWCVAGEAMIPGNVICFKPDPSGNTVQAFKADCTDVTKGAVGIYHGGLNLNPGDWAEFWLFHGLVTRISGLTPGTRYYLATGGLITATPVTANGYLSQVVGYGIAPGAMLMDMGSARQNVTGNTTQTFLRSV